NGYQDYVALDGDYSYNDYVAFDFTGKNMPEIAFFARNYDNYMYSEGGVNGGKHGVVVASGIMTYNGSGYSPVGDNCTKVVMGGPYMANFAIATVDGGSLMDGCDSELARANLVDGRRYRVIMGFTKASDSRAITLNYRLYNLEDNSLIEEQACTSYNLFGETETFTVSRDSLHGSIVLYGKFETVTTTIDKLWGVYENTTLDGVAKALGMFTATYQNWDGTLLQQSQYEPGQEPVYYGEEPYRVDDAYGEGYTFAGWEKKIVAGCPIYTASFTAEQDKSTFSAGPTHTYGVIQNGDQVVLKASNIANKAHYSGSNYLSDPAVLGTVNQSYLALDGSYSFNDYVAFDFTGKNMPSVAFFANNYNESMYYQNGDKYGLVVLTGLTTWEGELYTETTDPKDIHAGKGLIVCGPQMLHNTLQSGKNGVLGFTTDVAIQSNSGNNTNVALGRANLVDNTHYRVIMGMEKGTHEYSVKIVYRLYDITSNTLVEEFSAQTYNFFSSGFAKEGQTRDQYCQGSIVLYGHFGTPTTLDKVHGVFEDTDIATVAAKLNATYTVTFEDGNGNVLQQTEMPYGATPYYFGVTPEREDDLLGSNYQFAGWDKDIAGVTENVSYVATYTYDSHANNATLNGEGVVLGAGGIGDGANYTIGQNNDDGKDGPSYVHQSYLALDGKYGLNDYIVLDFNGKNLPEIAFFAKNYNDSMYAEGTSKQGIVVVTGITTYDGKLESGVNNNGTQINYGFPYMIQNAADSGFVSGAFANSALGRANLVDGTQYRVIMGFTGSGSAITLHWYLYNLDTNAVVEQSSMTTWNFFTGSNAQVGNMTLDDLVGSIVLYGKFGTTCTIDKVWGVYEDTTIDAIVESIMGENGEGGDEGSGEGSEGETTTYLLGYEKNDSQFDFYAYGSYSDGWYTINETDENGNTVAKDYYIGKHLGNLKQYSLYGGAGLTIYFPQDSFRITEDPQTIVNAMKLLDDLAKVGITKTILNDGRISWLSMLETPLVGSKDYPNEDALDEYVYNCLKDYATYPGVYGIQLGDEPKYSMLSAYSAMYKSIKRVCEKNGWPLHIQYNLNPMIYANEIFDGGYYDDGTGKKFDDYGGINATENR
ncbi:MAG: hypothetical protein J6K86_03965, partial [Clostridia bacterium]|nr:hypothetical protein [Clostridia bacterium]